MGEKASGMEARDRAVGFPVGAEVEVRSEDDGFRGSWYKATVAGPSRSSRGSRGYDVIYDTLVAEEDPSKPLREFVRLSQVRPLPPTRLTAGARYDVHQLVDAAHNDGWWAGVVSAVNGGDPPDSYTICFPSSREVMEFAPSELRPQLAWFRGEWCLADDQAGAEAKFSVGAQVEVSGDKENYGAVWFPGTVMKAIRKTIYLVEYWILKKDGDCELLRELVDAQFIRPFPPCLLEAKQFPLLSEVEAFNRCGWLAGVVSKILEDSKYIVRFKYRENEMEFHHSDLRIRRDWIGGRWCRVSKDKRRGQPSHAGKISSHPVPISTSSPGNDDNEATYKLPLKILKRNKEAGPSCEGQVEASQPCKKRKEGDTSDRLQVELIPKTPTVGVEVPVAMLNSESPSTAFIAPTPQIATGLPPSLSSGELSYGRTSSEFNGNTEVFSRGEESSNVELLGSEQQSKTPNVNQSHLAIELGKCKGVSGPKVDAPLRRKKLAVRGPQRQREVGFSPADVLDVRKHAEEDLNARRGSPHEKSIIRTHATGECMELQQVERTTDLVVESEQRRGGVDLSNGGATDDVSIVIQQRFLRDKVMGCENSPLISIGRGVSPLAAHHFTPQMESSARGGTSDVRKHAEEEMKKGRGSPQKKSIIHTHASVECMKLQQLESTDLVVESEQRREGVYLSNGGVSDDVSNVIQRICLRYEVMECENSPLIPDIHGLELEQVETPNDLVVESEQSSEGVDPSNGAVIDDANIIQPPCLQYEVMGCENSALVPDIQGVSPNSSTISNQATKHVVTLTAHHSTPQMESSTRGDTSVKHLAAPQLVNVMPSSFSSCVQEVLNFGNGLGNTGTEAERQVLLLPFKEGDAVAIANAFDAVDQEVSSFCHRLDTAGEEAETVALRSYLKEGSATSSGSLSKSVTVEERVSTDPSPRGSPSMKTTLPFVKNSSLWESIESMELFCRMPQQPHFRQLEMYSLEFREGMAIGLMVSFANLVVNMRKLCISDSRVALEESMKALLLLEANGFDVQGVRSRMEELLEIQNKQKKFEDKKAMLKEKIFERESEKDRLDALNVVFDKTIIELEQHITSFREERGSVVMRREKNESDIVRLQKDVQAAEEAYHSGEQHFDAVIASPW